MTYIGQKWNFEIQNMFKTIHICVKELKEMSIRLFCMLIYIDYMMHCKTL